MSRQSATRLIATLNVGRGELTQQRLLPRVAACFAGFEVLLPSLRDRLEDLPLMIQSFIAEIKGDAAGTRRSSKTRLSLRWPDTPGLAMFGNCGT